MKKQVLEIARTKTESPASGVLLSEEQLMGRVPLSRPTLKALRDQGKLPFIKVGRRVIYDWDVTRAAFLALA